MVQGTTAELLQSPTVWHSQTACKHCVRVLDGTV